MSANLPPPRPRGLARGGSAAAVPVTAAGSLPTGAVADLAYTRWQSLELRGRPTAALLRVLAASDFAFDVLQRHPAWIRPLLAGRAPRMEPAATDFARWMVQQQHAGALAAIIADVAHAAPVADICAHMSVLAECSIQAALRQAEAELIPRHGRPQHDGVPVDLVVYGMGKLGGGELNFSSDLDLVAAYAEGGETSGPRGLDHQEYFARQTRRMAQLLGDTGPEGAAWRVDLRLRPFGQAGQLALSFAAMEQYFQREGRDWERYAWIKARPVGGDVVSGHALLDTLRPFVYRRYLDYAAFEGLREMKALIDAEVRRQDRGDNLKLGPGGIREIEFLVQLEQLIRGGRMPALRTPGTLAGLAALAEQQVWPLERVHALRDAYLFLRQLENRVQMMGNAQTHDLPADAGTRERLAVTLGHPDWASVAGQLEVHRAVVRAAFADTIMPVAGGEARSVRVSVPDPAAEEAHQLWQRLQMEQSDPLPPPPGLSAELWQRLQVFAGSGVVRTMSARSRARLDRVVPMLWVLAQDTPEPEVTAGRLIDLLLAVARRTAYLALLAEQPAAARLLVRLLGASAWVAQRITASPILLDELIDPRLLSASVQRLALAREWQQTRAGRGELDAEAELEALKHFQQGVMLRLVAQFLFAGRSAGSVARALSGLADQVLQVVVARALQHLHTVHGGFGAASGFGVLAYGSLGGAELNFASDLDLVFVYDEALGEVESDGPRPLDGHRWFVRLAQRILHLLSVSTPAGPLYAVDTRLRPDGGKGLLVSAFDRFAAYQQGEAWMWEHQALVRARFVAGDARLRQRFVQVRQRVLGTPRDPARVRIEVSAMRQRMRAELDRSTSTRFDLKQGRGGLVDLEFALQALLLSHAGTSTDWPIGTPALLRELSSVLGTDAVAVLRRAHRRWLHLGLACTLSGRPRWVDLNAADARLRTRCIQVLGAWLDGVDG